MDLVLIWAALLSFAILIYVILDGFDLGIGILFPWGRDAKERDMMMNSIAPVWDGNETWLIFGGGGLFAAFPLAYSILMPALYIPVLVMLFALVFRGVAFEFRFKSERSQGVWDGAFNFGSSVAAFAQGLILGAFIQGLEVTEGVYTGGTLDWLTPFSLMTGFALMCGYSLLGATWLIIKTTGELQQWAYQAARWLLLIVLAWIAMVSLWTPLAKPEVAERWFSWPNFLFLSPIPVATLVVAFALWRALKKQRERAPFILSVSLFFLSFIGLAVSIWPYTIPYQVTLWETAAPPESQSFLLVGAVILVPLILGYTAFSYRIFKGKVVAGRSYY
ncbi:cytochrome d ubiquinol oxidase, subunit II [Nitrosococcus halophilus Nc 4]|uniref:Cytochrome d ubiquinol oxidase, subunit II n=1 Tax=Nitrosococcus halophilus (strain Nc4) TaxID=472759 RepID=D5C523_NITHN|nr:cytochrome d ubiquinol oxidase subunit II [Nitrosococcus halophilus]ADE15246.1 cytochrome d ubiquinol oxidase, subunit II [Nitrosococcus halophilus Nc 4]